jgi:hypothetical protein
MTQDEKLKYLESQRIKKIYQLGNFKDTDEFSEDKQSSSGQVKYKKPLPP